MHISTLQMLGLLAIAGSTLHGQPVALPGTQPPTTGATYYSTNGKPDCSSLSGELPVAIMSGSAVVGYSCYVSGTFVWLAAGGGWVTSLSVAAPASAAIGVDYSFYDSNGNSLKMDTTPYRSSATTSGTDIGFALSANQPSDINLQGATSTAPGYLSPTTGSVYAVFYCPDAKTCANLTPQLFYISLPPRPGVLSVPIAWDTSLSTQWSAQGIDDGESNRISLVVYNEDTAATSYTVRVYGQDGVLAGTGTTPPIAPLQSLGIDQNGYQILGQGGTYAALLSDVVPTKLPSGVFKILVDGGSKYSAVELLQTSGTSLTALQVGYDSAPGASAGATSTPHTSLRNARVASRLRPVFDALSR